MIDSMKRRMGAVLVAALVWCPLAWAADLTGHWVASQTAPNGQVRETHFYLKQDGEKLSGYLANERQGNMPIAEGKVTGEQITITATVEVYGQERKQEYTGTVTDAGLQIKPPAFGGGGGMGGPPGAAARRPTEMLAKRVSTDPPPPMKPKILLTSYEDVPANGLALTPPMGWNSWNKFRNQVSDKVVREIADAMVSSGMKDAGYVYVNIDDTWEAGRDAQGNIQTNERFPNMKALGDYLHSKGLKFGIYSSPGPKTCAGYEGSFNHEAQDARTYASWGVDYLKYDWCSAGAVYQGKSMSAAYAKMGQALKDSGRPIVYSLCQYGVMNVQEWGTKVGGNLWRTTGDIRDSWDSMSKIGFDQQEALTPYAAPGHWNDPDMLEIGNGGMSATEYRTHMSLWSMLAAPLLAGNDLRSMTPEILQILTNKEVIAVDQDRSGQQGKRAVKNGDAEVWVRPLAKGAFAVALFNRGTAAAKIAVHGSEIGLSHWGKTRDLWAHADLPATTGDQFEAEVPAHGVVMLRVEGTGR